MPRLTILFLVILFVGFLRGELIENRTCGYPSRSLKQNQVWWVEGTFDGRKYKTFREPKLSWLDALITCLKDGGMLTDFRNGNEYDFVRNLSSFLPRFGDAWIGCSDVNRENHFEWLSKETITNPKDFFRKTQPDGGRTENCCIVNRNNRGSRFSVIDSLCHEEYPFICVYSN